MSHPALFSFLRRCLALNLSARAAFEWLSWEHHRICPLLCSRFPRGEPGVQELQLLLRYHLSAPTGSHAVLEQEPSKQHKPASAPSSWIKVQDDLGQEGFCASSPSSHTIPAAVRPKWFLDPTGKTLKLSKLSCSEKALIAYLCGKWKMAFFGRVLYQVIYMELSGLICVSVCQFSIRKCAENTC